MIRDFFARMEQQQRLDQVFRMLDISPDEQAEYMTALQSLLAYGVTAEQMRGWARNWAETPNELHLTGWVDEVHYDVESKHHIHGIECLCGFKSHVSRDRTKHIVTETLISLGVEEAKP